MSSLVFSGFALHCDTSQVSPIIVNAAGVVGATFFGSRFLAANSFIPRGVGGFKGLCSPDSTHREQDADRMCSPSASFYG